jgi:mevalonate kinase
MTTATAPAKIILFGEHAVVYGRPAIAVPVTHVQASATVEGGPPGSGCVLIARDVDRTVHLPDAAPDDPLAAIVRMTLKRLNAPEPDVVITIHSTIPIASGMGSGAAVSTAIARALATHLGHALDVESVSALVFEVEKLYHGTPSGIDNTVIAHARPVFFVKDKFIMTFALKSPLRILIADTGIRSSTKTVVGDVRKAWEANRERYDSMFMSIGQIAVMARAALEGGEQSARGALMDGNHWLLRQLGVSSAELDRLVQAARQAGALGAKLSGAGRGGNAIALVTEEARDAVTAAMLEAGAKQVIPTVVS